MQEKAFGESRSGHKLAHLAIAHIREKVIDNHKQAIAAYEAFPVYVDRGDHAR